MPNGPFQRRRDGGSAQRQLRRFLVQDGGHGFRGRIPFEGTNPGEHLVQHRAKTENVGPAIDQPAAHLFRRHVSGGSQHRADLGCGCQFGQVPGGVACPHSGGFLHRLGQAKIQDLHPAVAGNKNIVGFQVAMGDVSAVRCGQTVGNLNSVVNGLPL